MYPNLITLAFTTLLILLLPAANFAQNKKYRIKEVRKDAIGKEKVSGVRFILAPKVKIGKEGLLGRRTVLSYNKKFRYQRLIFKNLGKNYDVNFNSVNNVVYGKSRIPIKEKVLQKKYNILRRLTDKSIPNCEINYSINRSNIMLEIDYEGILNSDGDLNTAFKNFADTLATNLLSLLANIEDENDDQSWAKGTSQLILEKVFDVLPLPETLVMQRFGYVSSNDFIFLLLQPKIMLQVDKAEMIKSGINVWEFDLLSTVLINFYRDSNGDIIQLPYLNFVTAFPNNRDTTNKTTLQASTADIHLSESTRYEDYIAFYQNFLKYNNNSSSDAGFPEIEEDSLIATSLIWHFAKLSDVLCGFTDCGTSQERTLSSFGKRNLAKPGFIIYLNDSPVFVPIETTLPKLRQHYSISTRMEWYRNTGKGYKKLVNYSNNTFLLPGDSIKFY